MAQARTVSGVVGIKVSILPPDAHIHDRIVITDELRKQVSVSEVEGIDSELVSEKEAKQGAGEELVKEAKALEKEATEEAKE